MLRRKLYRDLWHYKGQFFTIFLMVFIGMLAFSGIHGYMDGMDESAKEYYKNIICRIYGSQIQMLQIRI